MKHNQQPMEASITQKRHKRSIRILGHQVPLSILAILVCGMLVSGALVTILWRQATVNIQGNIDVNGQTQEISQLFYDGTRISGNLTITTMDISNITYGETKVFSHYWLNDNGHSVHIILNASSMPINGGGVETDPWFGFNIEFLDNVTQTPITEFDLPAISQKTILYRYSVNQLFEDPGIDFPFHLIYQATLTDKQSYGMGFGAEWTDIGDIYLYNTSGTLYTVKSYDESTTLATVTYPSSNADWTTIYSDVTAHYDNPLGVWLSNYNEGYHQTGSIYKAVLAGFDTKDSYVINASGRFDSRANNFYVIWHYMDSDNYFTAQVNKANNTLSIVQYNEGVPSNLWVTSQTIPDDTSFALKLKVDTEGKMIAFYYNGALKTTLSFE